MSFIEEQVPKIFSRIIGPAPEPSTLRVSIKRAIALLYKVESKNHLRKDGKPSIFLADLTALWEFFNGEAADGYATHHCWDSVRQRGCCRNKADSIERGTILLMNVVCPRADPIPAESTWTHTLDSLRRLILRRLLWRLGLNWVSQHPIDDTEEARLEIDAEALGRVHDQGTATRLGRTAKYYQNDYDQDEAVILTLIIAKYDEFLLYPFMSDGNPVDTEATNTLYLLLDWDTSEIGKCCQALSGMLDAWDTDDPERCPWGLLDALQISLKDQLRMRTARGNILRMSAAVARRYEIRFADLPFDLL